MLKKPHTGLIFLRLCFLIAGAGVAQAETPPIIGFISDFGVKNEAVGVCKAAMLRVAPRSPIVDVCHEVPAFDIWEGSVVLRETASFPPGSVMVAVVDPGVGSDRTAIALRTKKNLFYVAPNNGLLSWVVREQGVAQMIQLDPKKINPDWQPGTFDGRDLFCPAAAAIARAQGRLTGLGTDLEPERLVRFDIPEVKVSAGRIEGLVEREDHPYGNILSNVTAGDLQKAGIGRGDALKVSFAGKSVNLPLALTFSDVPEGKPLAYLDARGRLAFAVNLGNFAAQHHMRARQTFILTQPPPAP